ncbi:MAG: L,D-transpeptidase family protein [Sphingomonas sp.]|nr:L,D-transpeptidase family protein [Sphingomonas sp.]
MYRLVIASASAIGALLFGSAALPPQVSSASAPPLFAQSPLTLYPGARVPTLFGPYLGSRSLKLPDPVEPSPPTPTEALRDGVLIVVSLASQHAYVFWKGREWDSTQVSTGRPGYDTPKGTFPILQKKVLNRSTLYNDAPMPFMQRLTWDGVALHAGRVPGYPASHGCIRLPKAFAQKLYGITNFSSTIVVVTDQRVSSAQEARKLT